MSRRPVRSARRTGFWPGALAVLLVVVPALRAAEPTQAQLEFFENRIRPLLTEQCYSCHSHEAPKLKGGLSLEYRELWLQGGDTGQAIVPGDPEKSLLIKAVRYGDADLRMPPREKKLTEEQIGWLVNWVKMGAPDPRTTNSAAFARIGNRSERDHWAFKPVRQPPVPAVKDEGWGRSPVDAFVFAKLAENGLKPSPRADKRTLLRRATFDLIGLPPTLREAEEFLADDSPDAFAKVVDRLLAAPQYGERWGRYWLDTARYSDTKGEVKRNQEDFHYPFAWTYRDYVVRAFNEDKPYNRFILEQLAADKLNTGKERGMLAAMGFLTVGERYNGNANDMINDRIDVVTKGFLGLTVTCARCHDHKFDPIPTKDYYSLHGIFASSVEPREEPFLETLKTESPEYQEYAKKHNELMAELTALGGNRKGTPAAKVKELRQKRTELIRELAQLEVANPGAPPRAMVLFDRQKVADSHVLLRGEAENQGELVPRRFLEILSGPVRPVYRSGSGRLELAQAIASPANPLTARVLVNRVWAHHFGEGFVTTPDDFGNQSAPPSHPELLDYLAARFVADGWSLKQLHRRIMLTSVYQQSSANSPRFAQADPGNRLLWRANIRRLEFEAVRDSLLALGGRLDLTLGGRPVNLGASPYSTRRTLYGFVDRRNLPEVFNQFDFANPEITIGRRYETIVPQQALFMMNSPLVVEQARNLVTRPDFRALPDDRARIHRLYDLIYQRDPDELEFKLALNFLADAPAVEPVAVGYQRPANGGRANGMGMGNGGGKKRPGGGAMSLATVPAGGLLPVGSWVKYAHALLQSNEAMFIN